MPAECTLYEIVHRETGREYVGITTQRVQRRWAHHARAKSHIGNALRAYGAEAFDFRIITVYPNAAAAKQAEIDRIAARKPAFNKTAGGDGTNGYSPTEEHRERLRKAILGRKRSAEFCAKCRAKKVSAETREKIRRARLGQTWSVDVREKCAAGRRGKPNTAEAKAKISAALTGKPKTPEHVAKVAAALRKRGERLRAERANAIT